VNLFLNDTLIDENFILPKSYYLCIIRYQEETSIARGGEEQLDMKTDVKMDVKLDMELDVKTSHGRAREEREACASGGVLQAGPRPGQTGRGTGPPGHQPDFEPVPSGPHPGNTDPSSGFRPVTDPV
jgi:hypothetical protein